MLNTPVDFELLLTEGPEAKGMPSAEWLGIGRPGQCGNARSEGVSG
jgi:hypothetical protein